MDSASESSILPLMFLLLLLLVILLAEADRVVSDDPSINKVFRLLPIEALETNRFSPNCLLTTGLVGLKLSLMLIVDLLNK